VSKIISYCILICAFTLLIIITICFPNVLSDSNSNLATFINQGGFLSFLGVLVTITLASASNLYLRLNQYEKEKGEIKFTDARNSIKKSTYFLLIMLFLSIIIILIIKPILCNGERYQSIINSFCLLVLLSNILVLLDITEAVFTLEEN
jgi:hypothetical protein